MSRRRLSRQNFAFMRAITQGMDRRLAWERYMSLDAEHYDARVANRLTAWLRVNLATAARREGKHGIARLVQIDPYTLSEGAKHPTLDEFAQSAGLEDFSLEEIEFQYREAYGHAEGRRSPRARVIKRQLEALHWLEHQSVCDPQASDPISDWFPELLADRLTASGLKSLTALVDTINGKGEGWHRSIRGVGQTKARRIVTWLRENEATTHLAVGEHALVPRRELQPRQLAAVVAPATDVVPFEKLVVPAPLDGSQGKFRAPPAHCALMANTDKEAVEAWLASKGSGETTVLTPTQRSYRKEAERLLLWCVLVTGKAMSSITAEDAGQFRQFLQAPPASWCSPRNQPRWSPLWRPLEKPLSDTATRHAIKVLQVMFSWLGVQGYLSSNPFASLPKASAQARPSGAKRAFSKEQIGFALDGLKALPESPANRRLARALQWMYFTGLRLGEMVHAKVGDLRDHGDGQWMLTVAGQGRASREVAVPRDLVETLIVEVELEHQADGSSFEERAAVPILWRGSAERGGRLLPIARGTLYKQLKAFFDACAEQLRHDPKSAASFRNASTHWLRHSHAAHQMVGEGASTSDSPSTDASLLEPR